MEASPSGGPGLKRSLSVWAAVGISVALMAPSMAANINPQGTRASRPSGSAGLRMATVGVLLVAYGFVRLTQQFHHAGSVYGFVGVTLGPRAGVFSGWGLMGTYVFYACVTSMAAGIFGASFLQAVGIMPTADLPPLVQLGIGTGRSRWRLVPALAGAGRTGSCSRSRASRSR